MCLYIELFYKFLQLLFQWQTSTSLNFCFLLNSLHVLRPWCIYFTTRNTASEGLENGLFFSFYTETSRGSIFHQTHANTNAWFYQRAFYSSGGTAYPLMLRRGYSRKYSVWVTNKQINVWKLFSTLLPLIIHTASSQNHLSWKKNKKKIVERWAILVSRATRPS